MKPRIAALGPVALAAAVVACGGQGASQPPSAAADVIEWNRFASERVATHPLPPFQVRSMALVQVAVHDAVNAIEPRYAAYRYGGRAPGASLAAAVAAATRDTLVAVLPAEAAAVQARYDAALALIEAGPAREAGVAVGQAAATAVLAQRAGDELNAALGKPYAPRLPAPGVYRPTPPSNIVIGAGLGGLAPFVVGDIGALRSPAPHDPTSGAYMSDYDEVKALGSAVSTLRSAEQTETARFWFDAIAREWHQAARQGLASSSADAWQAARVLALVSVAMFDAVVASFHTKFETNYWRPITAIRGGDTDGNDATQGDAGWEPLCATPPFPEHNSTHAATAAAAAGVLARTLGDRHVFVVDSPTLAGARRTYHAFSEAAHDEAVSRLYCGIHFRRGLAAGLAQGDQVAEQVVGRSMQPAAALQ